MVSDPAMESDVEDDLDTDTSVNKRRRFEKSGPPTSIDVSNLNVKSSGSGVNNVNKFAILADLEIENDIAATKAVERIKLGKSTC